ncbi:hypothetical protein DYD21_11380 [Rhodohalobacter sp. SW132]|uniref:glycerophosphodiester phosphodiesterase n=1 Tax=Rhodohalobacter sp. SW132 TaxID=2293433 RepID=UPI000E2465F3|nr:glycerophosphodiester phosphodiesterase family protein [Rhodohalobacter sp. SW132]REL33373.1 hypothetical protein DYD21_11380 [Rhodohalobacter sp. SW132]
MHTLKSGGGIRTVKNRVQPVGGFKTRAGFFVIAHRGASFDFPENTMPAFENAFRMKADMIELDVLLSRDGIPVVMHDETLDRTTNGRGNVQHFLYRELQELNAGNWFGPEFSDVTIPSLQSVLSWAKGKIALNIEIKGEKRGHVSKTSIEPAVIELVRQFEMENHIVISSFSRNAIKRVKEISDDISTAILNSEYSYGTRLVYRMMSRLDADGLNMLSRQMKRPLMKKLSQHNVPVWIYTINSEAEMRTVIRKGATGIFSDRPDLLRKVASEELSALDS